MNDFLLDIVHIHTQMSLFGPGWRDTWFLAPVRAGGRKEDGHDSSGENSDWALGSPLLYEGGREDCHDNLDRKDLVPGIPRLQEGKEEGWP